MADHEKTDIEEMVDELIEDPDSPDKGDRGTPQTIDAEPSLPDTDAR